MPMAEEFCRTWSMHGAIVYRRKTGINRMQPATIMSPDVYDYYDVWKWGNRFTLGFNAAKNTNYMKKSFE